MALILDFINKFILYLNLGLYVLIIPGMMAQPFLGGIQLIIAGVLSFKYYRQATPANKRLLRYYWLAVLAAGLYIAIALLPTETESTFILLTSLFVVPMLIACYFGYVTHYFKKEFNN